VYTTYAYPYTVPTTSPSDALKGVDMAVWQAFQAHGCGTCFRPVLMTPSHLLDDPSGQTLPYYILSKLEFKTYDYMVDSYDDWGNLMRSIGEAGCKWTDVAWLNEPDKGARTLWRDQMTYISVSVLLQSRGHYQLADIKHDSTATTRLLTSCILMAQSLLASRPSGIVCGSVSQ
jgi:hypothetical protein